MRIEIVVWTFLILLLISSLIDIYRGLTKEEKEERTHYGDYDIVRGIIWLVYSVIMIML